MGRVGDYFTDVAGYVDPTRSRNQLWGTRIVNRRAELLDATTVLETAALDPYEFVRDAYLQRRRHLVYDGNAPPDRDFIDAPPKPRSSAPREPSVARGAEPAAVGSILVSADAQTPVQSTFSQEPSPSPATLSKPVMKTAEAAPAAQTPRLTQFWRALQLNFTAKD